MPDPNINKKISELPDATSLSDADELVLARSDVNYKVTGAQIKAAASTPAGSDKQVQFNDGGVLGADADLTYDKATGTLEAFGGYKGVVQTGSSQSTTYGAHVAGGIVAAGAHSGNRPIASAGGNGSVEIVVCNMVTADGNYHVFDAFICSHGQSWELQGAALLQKKTDGDLTLVHSSGGWDVRFENGTLQNAYWQIKSMNIVDYFSTKGGY